MLNGARLIPAGLLLCLAVAPAASAQSGGFEGVVVYKMTGDNAEMTQMYKGTKSRMEINSKGQAAVMLMDMTSGSMTTLIPQQKMYMTMNLKAMGDALKGFSSGNDQQRGRASGAPAAPPAIKATGRTETVAGHTCEWYVMGEKGDAEVCAAKGLGFFMFGQSPMGGGSAAMSSLAALGGNTEIINTFKDGFFPLKMARVQGGKSQLVMEATKVEPKTLDAALFAPPPDYTEMKMPFGR